ncbi:ABC transporter permease [Lacrimispora saccharolytica]|uniref:Binding-protein-dependent transport systems inner membrane component n=1 Tax=Lacrimispora saccharolytica (strain ATCC 35040 / DSM 2544 / NRCC 2533 / WM1) TaxID=610130 RepID=D9R7S5_LACSW|nr:ABC transporter permease [Lacrimispora saccharolytica]ADL05579.1 binding-protein-dependent transport systems inner membrane component [[Clostridium] saccharolyticum WM1]QRV20261.1 ABC transporter permease [Lacrimispora saccharolytica]
MKKSSAFIMVVPGLVILAVCLFLPLLRVLIPSFHTGDYPFSAYVDFFRDEYYLKIFMRTVKVAFLTTAVCMTAGVPTAYFISRCRKKWRGILLSVSIFPLMTNSVIRSFAWINILGSNGIINRFLLAAGFLEKPAKLLYTDFSIIIGSVYLFLPLMIVTVAGVMENIDDDMMEAALSLGADRFKAFMKVIFPISLPGIIVGGILVFTGTLTAYTTPQLLGGNKHMVLATFIYQRAMSVGDWNGAAVISLIMIVVTLAVIKGLNALSARLDRRGGGHA